MLTLTPHKDNVLLCQITNGGKKRQDVYWHPRKNKELRLAVDNIQSFNTEKNRDKFKLSHAQMSEILGHLKKGTTPEDRLQTKFFKVKKYIDNSLYTSMDLSGGGQKFEVNYPKGADTWGELSVVLGGSGSGKTTHLVQKILRNLNGPKRDRRKFLWVSNEFLIDKSLNELKKPRYNQNFRGIDISDSSFDNSEYQTTDDFYENEVRGEVDSLPRGSVVVFDDARSTPIHKPLLRKINKMLRTTRHRAVGLSYILHRIKSGLWSQQASSSCKYYVVFPKSGRGKIAEFLKDQGLTAREARETVNDFSEVDTRAMTVRLHAPQAFINEKLLRLF